MHKKRERAELFMMLNHILSLSFPNIAAVDFVYQRLHVLLVNMSFN